MQRPTVVEAVHDLFSHSPDLKVRLLAAQTLSLLCSKLMDRIKFLSEFVCEKQPGEMMFEVSEATEDSSDVTAKYDDVINTRALKQYQWPLGHYAVRTLSGALEAVRDQLEADEWKSCEQVQFFRESATLVHQSVGLCAKAKSANVGECRRVAAACLDLVHNWSYSNATTARFRRVAALVVVKAAVAFAMAFGGLVDQMGRLVLDATLHFTHSRIHADICSLVTPSNLAKFEQVKGTLIPSLKETAKLMHNKGRLYFWTPC